MQFNKDVKSKGMGCHSIHDLLWCVFKQIMNQNGVEICK